MRTQLLVVCIIVMTLVLLVQGGVHAAGEYVFLRTWGTMGSGPGEFDVLVDVFIDRMGRAVVADYHNNRIQVFSLEGTYVTEWRHGFHNPEKVAQDSQGNYFIADTDNGRIVKLSETGEFLKEWSGFWPRGVGVGPNDSVYVADWYGRVLKYTTEGTLVTGWGNNGEVNVGGYLEAVRTDAAGNIYVISDDTIVKLNPAGSRITAWGGSGAAPGQLSWPQDVFVDQQGNVFVADMNNHRIQKFSSDGELLATFGEFGTGLGQFQKPHGVGVDVEGNIYVADQLNNRIQVFTPTSLDCSGPQVYQDKGIKHCTLDAAHVLVINPRNSQIRFETVLPMGFEDDNGDGSPDGAKRECRDVNVPNSVLSGKSTGPGCYDGNNQDPRYPSEIVEEMADRYKNELGHNVIAAFNADFFDSDNYKHGPQGLTVKNGERFDGPAYNDQDNDAVEQPSLSILRRGDVRIGRVDASHLLDGGSQPGVKEPVAYWNTIGGAPVLVQRDMNNPAVGVSVVEDSCDNGQHCPYRDTERARTAVGKTANGELIVVVIPESAGVVLDDKQDPQVEDLSELMIRLGAVEAINLDGGGSSQLWYNGDVLVPPGRRVAEGLLVIERIPATISGRVFANDTSTSVAGATIWACDSFDFCSPTTTTDASGQYSVNDLDAGEYEVKAFPPWDGFLPGTIGPLTVSYGDSLSNQDIILTGPTPPPPGTTITSRSTGSGGLPVVYWNENLTLTTQGCPGGTASYELLQNGAVIRTGSMMEVTTGAYTATIPRLYPLHGYADVEITIICPDSTTADIQFDIYIDPSGHVRTVDGNPITGATVSLYRSDSASGSFEIVPDGSDIMSLANRNNPDMTDTNGRFGWDVVAGFYIVRAEKAGCVSPTTPSQTFAESEVLTIPPPVTDLDLRLECPNQPPIANAGGPYQANEGETITLDASGSSDPDGTITTYEWDLDNDGVFESTGQSVTFSAAKLDGPVSHPITMQVTDDDGLTATDQTTVEVVNVAPLVEAGPDQSVFRNDGVTLSGTWTDPAGSLDDPYQWSWDLDGDGSFENSGSGSFGDTVDETTSFTSEGNYSLTLAVTDKDNDTGIDTVVIEVLNQPPVCAAATPSKLNLWPPNHKFVAVDVLNVTDPESDAVVITIDSIFQDEPVEGTGDGNTVPDGRGVGTSTAEVRAERVGNGNGRVYHISFTADDGHGGTCTGKVLVGVPHNKKDTPIDDGALYDATAGSVTATGIGQAGQTDPNTHLMFLPLLGR